MNTTQVLAKRTAERMVKLRNELAGIRLNLHLTGMDEKPLIAHAKDCVNAAIEDIDKALSFLRAQQDSAD